MSDDTRPTPPTGMPAAEQHIDDSTGQKLLSAIQKVDDRLDRKIREDELRFARLEGSVAEAIGKTDQNTLHIGEWNAALLRVTSGAAKAVDLALEAKTSAHEAVANASQIVESALRLHGASIAATVDTAITAAVKPLVAKVDSLEENDKTQTKTLTSQDEQLALAITLLSKLSRWQEHWVVKLAIFIGTVLGVTYAALHH